MKKKIVLLAATSAFVLGACSGPAVNTAKIDRTKAHIGMNLERLGERSALRPGGSQFTDGIYVGAAAERNNFSALLPANLEKPGAIRLVSKDPLTLGAVSGALSEMTAIPHVMALGPTGQIVAANSDETKTAMEAVQTSSAAVATEIGDKTRPAPRNTAATSARGSAVTSSSGLTIRPNLRGSLSDVLDQVANAFEVEWVYSDGRILFRDYVTRKYQITALPTTSTYASAVGSNDITSNTAITSDVWAEVRDTMKGLVGEQAQVSIGSTTGLVTVTAKVSDQNRVQEYVEQLNGSLAQQITFDVNVLTVTLSDNQSFGLDLSAAIDGSDGAAAFGNTPTFGRKIADDATSNVSIGSVNIGVISGDVQLGAIVNALSSQGQVSVSNRTGATTSNNRGVPIEVVEEQAYLAEVSVEDDSNGNQTVTRTPGTVTTGFQMQLLPRVMNNRDIMVHYTVRLSSLNDLKTFGTGNEAVQLPEVSTTSFEQQAVLKNGQTLVLAGFERERLSTGKDGGVGGVSGGITAGHSSTESKVATVLLITPRLVSKGSTR